MSSHLVPDNHQTRWAANGRSNKRKNMRFLALALVLGGLCLATAVHGGQSCSGRVYLVLWFDVEDYVLPQTSDVVKRLATFLTQQGIRATFRVVGEKARMLEREGRRYVIEALDRHEIGRRGRACPSR